MRFVNVLTALFMGAVALLSLLPQATGEGCGGRSFYYRASNGPQMYNQPSYATAGTMNRPAIVR